MGLRVPSTFAAAMLSLTGCSLIYNPSNLPSPASDALEPDVMPDMMIIPVDADPALLEITDVSPREILEGQGIDGSRRAVVVITGANIVNGATVQITAHAGETGTPLIHVDNEDVVVSTDGVTIAVPITVDVDPLIGPGVLESIRLDVAVTQPTAGEPVTKQLVERETADDPILTLRGLREQLGGGTLSINLAEPKHQFSKIDATALAFTGTGNIPVIESVSSITIANLIPINASGQTAGIGGGNGGAGGPGGLVNGSPGSAGTGDGRGSPSGGGGSFGTAGNAGPGSPGLVSGDASLPTLDSSNRGSGGAGGDGVMLAAGGAGGGGGGSISITAGGDLTFSAIDANGGNGTNSNVNDGGGGSGGSVLVRAGKSITVSGAGVTAKGGTSPGTGAGGNGRVRFDAGVKLTTVASDPPVGHRGAMLDSATALIVRDQTPVLSFNGQPGSAFSYTVEDVGGTETPRGPVMLTFPGNGTVANHDLVVDLFRGISILCVRVEKSNGTADAGKNCVAITFIP